jgi:hypothetical protein
VAAGDADPVGALVASLQADPDLAEVERLDDGGSVLASLNDVPFSVLVAEQTRAEWIEVPEGASGARPGDASEVGVLSSGAASSPPINCDPANYPRSKRACILRQLEFELGIHGEDSVEHFLQRAAFEIVPLLWPTKPQDIVELHQTLGTCGVIYILAHGHVGKNLAKQYGNHLATDIDIPREENRQVLGAAFGQNGKRFFGKGGRVGKAHLTLSPHFFESLNYPNSFVFINSCSGDTEISGSALTAGGRQLRDVFREKGAGTFIGWTAPIPIAVGIPAAREIFRALSPEVEGIDAVTLTIEPADPDPGQAYTPIATVSPPQAGIEVGLSVRGSDGYTQDETGITGVNGDVFFSEVPGGQGEVTDIITVAAGAANNAQTALEAVLNSPTLQKKYSLHGSPPVPSAQKLSRDGKPDFNLVCNNPNLTQMQIVVKF